MSTRYFRDKLFNWKMKMQRGILIYLGIVHLLGIFKIIKEALQQGHTRMCEQ